MKIIITGASGLVGTELVNQLISKTEHELCYLTRDKEYFKDKFAYPGNVFEWDTKKGTIDSNALKDVDIIIHLAGENVASGRWSQKRKQQILDSRVKGTQLLVNEINKYSLKPKAFISSSAIGIYGNRPNEELTEESSHSDDFLANVCKEWESITSSLDDDIRICHLRTSVVLSNQGGALLKMLPPFLAGAGGTLGLGKFHMSWIHIQDLVNIFIQAIDNKAFNGPINATSPEPITNKVFTKALGKAIAMPTIFPVPTPMLKILFGEMSSILLADQKVIPKRLQDIGFNFNYPNINQALKNILKDIKEGYFLFNQHQWVERSKDEVFDFFSKAENLEKLTPETLSFKILKKSTPNMQKGMLIDYKLKIHGIPCKWKTLISEWEAGDYFVDTQIKGPYKEWIHKHSFSERNNGTWMRDQIKFKTPFGRFGFLIAGFFIMKDLKGIFSYRKQAIEQIFG